MSQFRPRPVRGPDLRPPDIKLPPRGPILIIVLILLAILLGSSAFYTVQPGELAVITRFGKFSRTSEPGFHFKWPVPFERVARVAVEQRRAEEFGFRTQSSRGSRSVYDEAGDYLSESLMLTGDLNVLEVQWITQYQVSDPYKYLFRVRNLTETFRDMNESVMRLVVGDRSVNEVLTVGRQEIAAEVSQRLQELCDQYQTGIQVREVILQDVRPPETVQASFNEVNQAQQERERMINEARREFNSVIPRARGEAQQTIQAAEGYATDRINRAEGDVAAFNQLLEAYKRSPEVTRRRIYLETMQEVLPRVKRKIVIDEDVEGLLPMLQLGKGGGE